MFRRLPRLPAGLVPSPVPLGSPWVRSPARRRGNGVFPVTLLVLEPPYDHALPPGRFRPAPGAILVADLAAGIPALSLAVSRARETPWCPTVVALPDARITRECLSVFEHYPGSFAPLYPQDWPGQSPSDRLRAAVARRPVPHAAVIAQWVEARLGQAGAASLLEGCFGHEDDAPAPRTLTRRLGDLGPLEVRDWRGLARLAQILAVPRPRRASAEVVALEAGVDPRSLRRWLGLATTLAWREARELAGWEWVLESALRRWGYFEWEQPVARRLAVLREAV